MRKQFFIVTLLFLLFQQNFVRGQDEMFKALFMYNFTKDIEWPAEYKNGDFTITVIGSNEMFNELQKIAAKKKVGNQTIVVKKASDASEIGKTHIVYLSQSRSAMLSDLTTALLSKPVVIITDKPGLASQGAAINYVKVDGKQKFEIAPSVFDKHGLKVNSFLTSLGIVIN